MKKFFSQWNDERKIINWKYVEKSTEKASGERKRKLEKCIFVGNIRYCMYSYIFSLTDISICVLYYQSKKRVWSNADNIDKKEEEMEESYHNSHIASLSLLFRVKRETFMLFYFCFHFLFYDSILQCFSTGNIWHFIQREFMKERLLVR